MAHNRAQLNALIFHNPVVLPRTSPGYAEMTIAVAELQGGNNAKAALYAESAVTKDPTLAAGWLAKTAADVFEATPDDLRQDRALFCVDRALECAPACHREIIDFVVANILGHYVEVLCGGALTQLARWQELEAYAVELEDRALSLDWQAAQLHGSAALLGAAGLVTGMVALFSRRLGTQVFSGVASVAAFSEAARLGRDAMVLEGMAAELRMAGYAQRLEGQGHRAASLHYLVPARDLIGMAARLLQAVGSPPQPLDRLVHAFTHSFRQVLSTHLHQLNQEIGPPMSEAIDGKVQPLAATYGPKIGPLPVELSLPGTTHRLIAYGKELDAIRKAAGDGLYTGLNPLSRDTMRWLENMMPGVQGLEAFGLLSRPLPTIAHAIYGFREGTRSKRLPDRMQAADKAVKMAGGYLILLTLGCLFIPPVFLLPGAFVVWCIVVTRRRIRAQKRLRAIFDSLWSVDTWLERPGRLIPGQSGATGAKGQQGPPPLPVGAQGGKAKASITFADLKFIFVVAGSVTLVLFALLALLLFGNLGGTDPSTAKGPGAPAPSAAPHATGGGQGTSPEVRRATAVRRSAPATPASAADPAQLFYVVVNVPSGDTLNVRAGPGANNKIVARLPNGSNHLGVIGPSVTNGSTEWVPIKVGDQTGWVTKQHLQRE